MGKSDWKNIGHKNYHLPTSLEKILCAFLACLHHSVPILPKCYSSGRVWPSAEGHKLFTSSFHWVWSQAQETLGRYQVCFSSELTECNTAWFSLHLSDNCPWMEWESGSIQGKVNSLLSGGTQGLQQTSLSLTHSSHPCPPASAMVLAFLRLSSSSTWKHLQVWDWCLNNHLFCSLMHSLFFRNPHSDMIKITEIWEEHVVTQI